MEAWREQHTLFNCFRQFQRNQFSVEDAPRSDRPSTFLTEQIIEDDSHSTSQQIETSLPRQSIHHYFNLRKVCASDQKQV